MAAISTLTELPVKKEVRNLTALRIGIAAESGEGQFVIPPFGKRTLAGDEEARFKFKEWQDKDLIDLKEITITDDFALVALGCCIMFAVTGLILVVILALIIPSMRENFWIWIIGYIAVLVLIGIAYGILSKAGTRIRQWSGQIFIGILIIAVVFGLPLLVIYFFGDGMNLIPVLRLQLTPLSPGLLARGLQWMLIALASLLPIVVYFLFDRQKLRTLRENFYREIVRLDPSIQTLDEARQTYRHRVEDIYGPEDSESGVLQLHSTQVPVLVATLVITLGWIIALMPIGDIADKVKGTDLSANLSTYLFPQLTAISFGFLGAYVFGLQMLFRRYATSDLSPKVYTHITVRIFVVIITVWVLSALFAFGGNVLGVTGKVIGTIVQPTQTATLTPSPTVQSTPTVAPTVTAQPTVMAQATQASATPQPTRAPAASATSVSSQQNQVPSENDPLLLVFAFFIGFIPETGMAVIQEYLRKQTFLSKLIPSTQEEHPLYNLEGVNLYYQARLLEDGIENIQNLAHHDLIELMLRTRIPMPILVDWVDQAILYLHLVTAETKDPQGNLVPRNKSLQELRKYGIRTATDLVRAHEEAEKRDTAEAGNLLGILKNGGEIKPLRVILDALVDDEWLAHITHWRELNRANRRVYTIQEIKRLTQTSTE